MKQAPRGWMDWAPRALDGVGVGGLETRSARLAYATWPHRLVAKDTTLSRWRHGFESRWGCQS